MKGVLIPSYFSYERDLLATVRQVGLAEVKGAVGRSPDGEWRFDEAPADFTALKGAVLRDGESRLLDSFGKVPAANIAAHGESRVVDAKRLDVPFSTQALARPLSAVGRLDTSHVAGELLAFTLRIVGWFW